MADLSPRGMKNSFGIMVNYRYKRVVLSAYQVALMCVIFLNIRYILESCEANSQSYVDKQHIEASEKVLQLLAKSSPVSNLSRL
jgi:hypothetical protein